MKKISILDTTLRDGAQSMGVSFSLEDKIRIALLLDEFGIDYIEAGWPGSNNKDMTFFNEIKKYHLKKAKITAFSSTKRPKIKIEQDNNIKFLLKSEAQAFTIFGKSWDFHVKKALEIDLEENLEMIYTTISYLKKYANEVIYDAEHFFDGYKSNSEYAVKTIRVAEEAGADIVVLADTNGGTMWYEVEKIVSKVKRILKKPIGIHAQNDAGLAVVNSLIAVAKGASHIQGTINGLGERCGNADLCTVIPNLYFKMKIETIPKENLKMLTNVSYFVSELINRPRSINSPYVGEYAFAHKGGVHVSAMMIKCMNILILL
jgi:2-isopropylmalate synthase